MRFFYVFPLLVTVTALARPCGLTGTIEERIKDCNQMKGNFILVTETEKGGEFYKDQKSGLIWGRRILSDFNHYSSQKACSKDVAGYEVLNHLKWRLPTIREFEKAAANGMKSALSKMDYTYWSSTPVKRRKYRRRKAQPAQSYLWDGYEEKTDTGELKDAASVRCVARE